MLASAKLNYVESDLSSLVNSEFKNGIRIQDCAAIDERTNEPYSEDRINYNTSPSPHLIKESGPKQNCFL